MFTSQESGLPLFSVATSQSNTNQGQNKPSLRISDEAVRLPYGNTKRGKRTAHPLQGVAHIETSHISSDDCFAALQIVMVTKRLLRPMSVLLSY